MRDTVIIAAACLFAILLGAWLFFFDVSQEPEATTPSSFSVLAEGQQSGTITERTNYRIRSADELNVLWGMIYGTGGPAAPGVNFDTSEVLAVFDGTHSSGGYGVKVESVEDAGLTRTISIQHTQPGDDCVTLSAVTSPFVLVVVSKSGAELSRNERTETVSCN